MKRKLHIILIFLIFGILMPNFSYACASNVEKTCCKKESSSKKDCCKTKKTENKDNNCEGKCGNSNCTTSSVSYSFIEINTIELKLNTLYFLPQKISFHYPKTIISSGFTSVWLPPKI